MQAPASEPFALSARFLPALLIGVTFGALIPIHVQVGAAEAKEKPAAKASVSYYREIRPILQANCQGCHQPAKAKGGYVMTDFKKLLAGGDSEGAAVVPKHAEQSAILKTVSYTHLRAHETP